MAKTKNVSKSVSNSEYEKLHKKVIDLIPGKRSFNLTVAKKYAKMTEDQQETTGIKPVSFDTARMLVSDVKTGKKVNWKVLELMYEEVKEHEKIKERMSRDLLEPEIRFQKVE